MSHLRKIRTILFVIPVIVTSSARSSVSINGAGLTLSKTNSARLGMLS